MTDADFFQLQRQSLLFPAVAGLIMFFVSVAVMRHVKHPWFRLCALLPFLILSPLAAYSLTHNRHVALLAGLGCGGGMAFTLFFQANHMTQVSEKEKDDSNGKQQ